MCVCGCVLHIQALETHTAIQDYARARVQAACTVSRRQAAPRPQTVSHTSMLRRQEQLTKYPTTNKKHKKPWEFSGTEWMSQIESGEGVRGERWKRISKNENLSIPYWPFWPLHSHHSLQMKVSFQVRPKCEQFSAERPKSIIHAEVLSIYSFLRDVRGFRGKVTRGGKDVVALKASTFVLVAPVCFWLCWFWVLSLFNRAVVCLDKSIQSCFFEPFGKAQVKSWILSNQVLDRKSVCQVKPCIFSQSQVFRGSRLKLVKSHSSKVQSSFKCCQQGLN